MSAAETVIDVANRLPPAGPNKLAQAMEDYDHLLAENAALKDQVKNFSDLSNKLAAENDALHNQIKEQQEFYRREIVAVTVHRDRLERFAKGLTTRLKVIRECIAGAETEATMEAVRAAETPAKATAAGAESGPSITQLPMNDIG